ncbi:MAG: triose-phosphate isomerase [Coriobacteriaceae bacterium]|nr:triose-phosphate isomerase [Coriobacteriaceae bacterium]
MDRTTLRTPFFVVNPKSYVYGADALSLARKLDELACRYDVDVLFTAQLIDLPVIIGACPHLIPCAQHMDSLAPGRGMGHVLPEALAEAGVKATFLNHAEKPQSAHELARAIARAREVGLLSVVCADSVDEGRWIAHLEPDVMVCELTDLIGTGRAADEAYMRDSTDAVRGISPGTKVLQAAGISCGADVYRAIACGADGTGGTSGIVSADDPFATLEEMFEALDRARADFCREA